MAQNFFDTFNVPTLKPPVQPSPAAANPQQRQRHDSADSSVSAIFESASSSVFEQPPHSDTTTEDDATTNKNHFGVFEEFQPEWTLLNDTFRGRKEGLELKFDQSKAELSKKMETEYERLSKELIDRQEELEEDRRKFELETNLMKDVTKFQKEKVKLNVGGYLFETSITTLTRDRQSMLAAMFSGRHALIAEADGSYFIDRDGTHFRLILNYLRDLRIPSSVTDDQKICDELIQEARFYQIDGLLKLKWLNLPRKTQDDLLQMYPSRPYSTTPTLFNLVKMDLSGLDFRNYHVDPKSTFTGSNLEGADFENAYFGFDFNQRVDFSHTNLTLAKFPAAGSIQRAPGMLILTME
ncbi:hypothetical protein BC937DRAFT_91991 [Endogone sp. FLAS-F59071]|nr:hypothetical protein BC937DRAFT_91991 [Endogone sp. FLAS-F59071]|eukprot:RUS21645.1 hypothetical protein BC937DRAFT_91991 [Endogone sp. FLAS-F59071]